MVKKGLFKKVVALSIAVILGMTAVTGCGKSDSDNASGNVSADGEMDLGGMEIIIGDWWSPETPAEPTTTYAEAQLAYREEIQKKYNFTMKEVAIAEWDTMQELFVTSTLSEDPAAQVFILDYSFVSQPMANGLFYDLATLDSLDFSDDHWDDFVMDVTTIGDSIYGMRAGKAEPRKGVFWNKRLFKEAGLDEDLLYDLQASGEWTWEKFEELCKILTYDNNNDGTMDSYAMASLSTDIYRAAVASNNADFVGKDENGQFYNATNTPEFLEAIQWVTDLIAEGYEMPTPEGSEWDWFIDAFHDGKVAMTVAEQHKVSTWADMSDDYGFVLFPKGPKADNYVAEFTDNIAVIPSCYDKETAEKIAFAYSLWVAPVPGYEGDDDWKVSYYTAFRDERAVDETLALMYQEGIGKSFYLPMVYGIAVGDIVYDCYGLWKTPAEAIEGVQGTWDALIKDANRQ